jgi:hypothetical protein
VTSTPRFDTRERHPARGLDLTIEPVEGSGVASLLQRMQGSPAVSPSFVLIRLATTDQQGFEQAVKATCAAASGARVCLAVDRTTLARLGASAAESGVGLVLDDVDSDTPLSSIASHLIEAVRFKSAFVASASKSLRQSSILRAMMNLAHELGLATVVSGPESTEAANDWTLEFDCITQPSGDSPELTRRRRAA